MIKRLFDMVFSFFGIILLLPFFVVISILILIDSKGGILYLQTRVGRDNKDFKLFKFRTMRTGSDKIGLLTVGDRDSRITGMGYWLRKYKLDELPQLFNVLKGDMSFVGPRPEVRKYVNLYTEEQLKVLTVRPGITDNASIKYANENELLLSDADPEKFYINKLLPAKLKINLEYLSDQGLINDLKIILKTVFMILKR